MSWEAGREHHALMMQLRKLRTHLMVENCRGLISPSSWKAWATSDMRWHASTNVRANACLL